MTNQASFTRVGEGPQSLHRLTSQTLNEEPESFDASESTTAVAHAASSSMVPKQHRTTSSRRLSGRAAHGCTCTPYCDSSTGVRQQEASASASKSETKTVRNPGPHIQHIDHANQIISRVSEWVQNERHRQDEQRNWLQRHTIKSVAQLDRFGADEDTPQRESLSASSGMHDDIQSMIREANSALERLEKVLTLTLSPRMNGPKIQQEENAGSYFPRRKSLRQNSRNLLRSKSGTKSDNELNDESFTVSSAEVFLDNSRTLSYSGGSAVPSLVERGSSTHMKTNKSSDWLNFKLEILRLTHTLQISGWRHIPPEESRDITVERLSGALTNAVYVVSPPAGLDTVPAIEAISAGTGRPRRRPRKLLLRIYGPEVADLIDRESELQILRRLARKHIGPRLLGTFINGRFEEFFHARTLDAKDLHIPDTSKQIAKRMRELHDGIDLLQHERDNGASVWRNWDKWLGKCKERICWLDRQAQSPAGPAKVEHNTTLVCGVEWIQFEQAVSKYRAWLYEQYGGADRIRDRLVFAHNDTQYGNLLRLQPGGESPLLHPANEHKQLVVIDFEYASANMPGLEFANHFTEWCYNYHDESKSYTLHESRYPTIEEQRNFIRAYVQHISPARTATSPKMPASTGSTGSITAFMLDSRAPPGQYVEEERHRETFVEDEIARLCKETRIWRLANSAQWIAWGVVQANIPLMEAELASKNCEIDRSLRDRIDNLNIKVEMQDQEKLTNSGRVAMSANDEGKQSTEVQLPSEEDLSATEEFDYLAYAHERAMLFWGDMLQLGLIDEQVLPADVLSDVKMLDR